MSFPRLVKPSGFVGIDTCSLIAADCNLVNRSKSDSLIVSCSNGNLSHLVPDDSGELVVDHAWSAHEYEPWITAYDLWRPEVVWSGKSI